MLRYRQCSGGRLPLGSWRLNHPSSPAAVLVRAPRRPASVPAPQAALLLLCRVAGVPAVGPFHSRAFDRGIFSASARNPLALQSGHMLRPVLFANSMGLDVNARISTYPVTSLGPVPISNLGVSRNDIVFPRGMAGVPRVPVSVSLATRVPPPPRATPLTGLWTWQSVSAGIADPFAGPQTI